MSLSIPIVLRRAAFLAGLVLVVGLAVPQPAAAQKICKASRCGVNQERVEVESKTCKANKKRPAITVTRACCAKPNGKLRCKKFPKCPKKSPSAACV